MRELKHYPKKELLDLYAQQYFDMIGMRITIEKYHFSLKDVKDEILNRMRDNDVIKLKITPQQFNS